MIEYLNWHIDGCQTQVMRISARAPTKILLFIPGNPGIAGYYQEYLLHLHSNIGGLEIVCPSYPGHVSDIDTRSNNSDQNNDPASIINASHSNESKTIIKKKLSKPLSLQEQISHKVALLDHVHSLYPDCEIILGGHSLGSYMCLQLLHHRQNIAISKVIALFPTFHSMKDTPQGQIMQWIAQPIIRYPLHLIVLVVMLRFLVKVATGHGSDALDTTLALIRGGNGFHALHLVHDELRLIKSMPSHLKSTLDNRSQFIGIHCYYGSNDGWVPRSHFLAMKNDFPSVKAVLCKKNVPHAFVIHDSLVMAEMTLKFGI